MTLHGLRIEAKRSLFWICLPIIGNSRPTCAVKVGGRTCSVSLKNFRAQISATHASRLPLNFPRLPTNSRSDMRDTRTAGFFCSRGWSPFNRDRTFPKAGGFSWSAFPAPGHELRQRSGFTGLLMSGRRGEIFHELRDELGADAARREGEHLDRAANAAGAGGDQIAGTHLARSLHALFSNEHLAIAAGVGGKRAGFEHAHGPKPLIDACFVAHGKSWSSIPIMVCAEHRANPILPPPASSSRALLARNGETE